MAQSSSVLQWVCIPGWSRNLLNPVTRLLIAVQTAIVLLPVDLSANNKENRFDFLRKIHRIVPFVVVVFLAFVRFGFGTGGVGLARPGSHPGDASWPIIIP